MDPTAIPVLVIKNGPLKGRRLRLRPGAQTCGRDARQALPLDVDGVADEHCAFELTDGRCYVVDIAGGTRVNGEDLEVEEIFPGDLIEVGPVVLELRQARRMGPFAHAKGSEAGADERTESMELEEPPRRCGPCGASIELHELAEERALEFESLFVCGSCAAKAQWLVGRTVKGFRVDRLVRVQSVGAVYEAEQLSVGRRVEFKALRITPSITRKRIQHFINEVAVLQELQDPRLRLVLDAGGGQGLYYTVLAPPRGERLMDLARRSPLKPSAAVHLVAELAQTLELLHGRGLVHRAINPANVYCEPAGSIVLDGFVDVRAPRDQEEVLAPGALGTKLEDLSGMLEYYAPEQVVTPQAVDARADVYSLGAVLHFALLGEIHLGSQAMDKLDRALQALWDPPKAARRAIVEVVRRLRAERPAGRPADARAAGAELTKLATALGR